MVLAGAMYGSGSSRDWAAKGPMLLGVKAVIGKIFERIHRSNLVGMGIIPLCFKAGEDADTLGLTVHERYNIDLPNNINEIRPCQDTEHKRPYNCEIMLSKVKRPLNEWMEEPVLVAAAAEGPNKKPYVAIIKVRFSTSKIATERQTTVDSAIVNITCRGGVSRNEGGDGENGIVTGRSCPKWLYGIFCEKEEGEEGGGARGRKCLRKCAYQAAEKLKITANDTQKLQISDGIIAPLHLVTIYEYCLVMVTTGAHKGPMKEDTTEFEQFLSYSSTY
ncbi:hypothetical protein M8C21_001951 [Ambrosia artemisiifolia]|uniref:Aconitase A/isopropylmalate dehydratase small subunit swivel domain-containing protein n=1 Tax=Ambrosia artemisiifolia TaxID=4212 RepID=A0AAD5GVQ8_AMBAR|nr:hypothetical protein M8C21_001951 [Ambrosia artemisiifolia]